MTRTNRTNKRAGDGAKRDLLRAAFDDPERLKPSKSCDALAAEAAQRFAALAQRLRARLPA